MILTANRASAVLCNFLRSKAFSRPFLLPANACPVVPLSFQKAGVDFEFADIDDTHAMSQTLAKAKIASGRYAGLVFIHSYGRRFDNSAFYRELKEVAPDLCIIDDRCLCPPELTGQQPENTDLVLYSTGYAKYVELLFGGFGVTQSVVDDSFEYKFSEQDESRQQDYIKTCLRDGRPYDLPADYPWLNGSGLPMSQASYFDRIREMMPGARDQRSRINQIYRTHLPEAIQWGPDYENWRFMVSVEKRDDVLNAIFASGLFAGANYPSVSYLFKKQHSPRAEEEAMHTLNLINNHRVDEAFALNICEVINTNM